MPRLDNLAFKRGDPETPDQPFRQDAAL